MEAMRLRPAVWVLTRRAVTATELGGYRIPAGADIIYSPYAIQRDPKSYADNLEFDPDRWLPERAANVPKYAMKPFSVGNRKCPSDHFSMAQLTLITAALATKYRFEQVAAPTTRSVWASRCARTTCWSGPWHGDAQAAGTASGPRKVRR